MSPPLLLIRWWKYKTLESAHSSSNSTTKDKFHITYSASFTSVRRCFSESSMSIAKASSSSRSCTSTHMLIRTSRGILLSSGKEAKSKKHSLTLADKHSILILIRSISMASWESEIVSPLDSLFLALCQTIGGWPLNEAPITLRARGSPLHSATTCLPQL